MYNPISSAPTLHHNLNHFPRDRGDFFLKPSCCITFPETNLKNRPFASKDKNHLLRPYRYMICIYTYIHIFYVGTYMDLYVLSI